MSFFADSVILDFFWTGERPFLSPSNSLLSRHEAAFFNCSFWRGLERQISLNSSRTLFLVLFCFGNFLFGFTVKNIAIPLLQISMLTAPIAEANDCVLARIHGNRLQSFRHKQPDIDHIPEACSIARAQKSSTVWQFPKISILLYDLVWIWFN